LEGARVGGHAPAEEVPLLGEARVEPDRGLQLAHALAVAWTKASFGLMASAAW
jgi:hypothetical protein